MQKLIDKLSEILEEDVNEESILDDFEEWDSLAVLQIISFFNSEYSLSVAASQIKNPKTVKDLYNLRNK